MQVMPESLNDYPAYLQSKTLDELLDINGSIDRELYPEKARMVMEEIEKRPKKENVGSKGLDLKWDTGFDSSTLSDAEILDGINKLDKDKGDWKKNILAFLVTILIFSGMGLFQWKPIELFILIVVIFIHELGHFFGMKIFGYVDPKIFFIPGFGAATSAKKGIRKFNP